MLKLARQGVQVARRYAHTRSPAAQALLQKNPDDVVVTFAKRSAMGRAKKGQFKDTSVDELLFAVFKTTLEQTKLNPSAIDDICVGTCHPPSPLYVSRAAALAAGIPADVPVSTVNRLCSSGLMAIRSIVNDIRAGEAKLGIAVGVESMSLHPRPTPQVSATVGANALADDCIQPMGWTNEMVAQHFKLSREKQDEYALRSHERAIKASASGIFAEEILRLRIGEAIMDTDDTVRPGVTLEGLSKLKPAFTDWGGACTTAGNASGIGDGAAVLVITTRANAEKENMQVIAKWGGCVVAGVEPRYMGIAPVAAIPKLLKMTGLAKEDINVWEINEAFAAQFGYCVETLDLPIENVNPQGGSIALSHPLGMTGARLPVTGLAELRRRNEPILCTSMCIGSGMGAAAIFVNEL
ncbi:putative 3-ketoacyl-CoA thiolase B, partial [Auricularia subglabra TFB-10046 SS5]